MRTVPVRTAGAENFGRHVAAELLDQGASAASGLAPKIADSER
jgi:hypothetical protein